MVGHHHDADVGGQGLAQVLGGHVDHRQLLLPLHRGDPVGVPGPVQVAVVQVGQRGRPGRRLQRGGEALPDAVGADELRAALAGHRQPGGRERALVHHRRVHAGGGHPAERGRVGLPLAGVDAGVPEQRVEQPVAARDAGGVPDDPVRARGQGRAQRREAGRGGGRHPHRRGGLRAEQRVQERRLLGVVAQQLVAEAVDEEDDVPPTLGELDRGGAEAGVDTHRGRDRGQDVAERAVAVGRGGELVGHRAGVVPGGARGQHLGEGEHVGHGVDPVGGGADPDREVVGGDHAGVAVVGLALRVRAAGRLEVDPADAAPADGQDDLVGAGRRDRLAGVRRRVGHHAVDHHRAARSAASPPRWRSRCTAPAAGRPARARRCAPG